VAGVVAVYATLFGIGKLVFGELTSGAVTLLVAALAFAWIARSFRNETPTPDLERVPSPAPVPGD
jgi:hypothetical protein